MKHSAPALDKAAKLFAKGYSEKKRTGLAWNKVTFSEMLSNKLLMGYAVREGLPYSVFELIKAQSPFDLKTWADYLDLSEKSLQRYKVEDRGFKPLQSSKILEIAEVIQLGLEVFGEMESLRRWFDTPVFALGNHRPAELLKDSFGKDLVVGELTRIEYGIFG